MEPGARGDRQADRRRGTAARAPNREHADQLLAQARQDLASAEVLRDDNPKRAYESLCDAARMALTAVLVAMVGAAEGRARLTKPSKHLVMPEHVKRPGTPTRRLSPQGKPSGP